MDTQPVNTIRFDPYWNAYVLKYQPKDWAFSEVRKFSTLRSARYFVSDLREVGLIIHWL